MNLNKNLTKATLVAIAFSGTVWALYQWVLPDNRILKLLGGDVAGGGYIQFLTFATFVWAMLEIKGRVQGLTQEYRSFEMDILPTQEHYVIYPEDMNKLRLKIIDFEKSQVFLLSNLVKKACTKFIRTKSVSEIQELISSQVKINQANAEGKQSVIRYLLWVIPSLGFIGTVLGISQALTLAGAVTSGDTKIVTDTLGVAFDTTLVALVLSVLAMYSFHGLQGREDQFHADMEEYAINNLVNRIDTQHG